MVSFCWEVVTLSPLLVRGLSLRWEAGEPVRCHLSQPCLGTQLLYSQRTKVMVSLMELGILL